MLETRAEGHAGTSPLELARSHLPELLILQIHPPRMSLPPPLFMSLHSTQFTKMGSHTPFYGVKELFL